MPGHVSSCQALSLPPWQAHLTGNARTLRLVSANIDSPAGVNMHFALCPTSKTQVQEVW